jgi:YihY family inner membrane protein
VKQNLTGVKGGVKSIMATQATSQQQISNNGNAAGTFLGNVNHKTKPLQAFITKFNNDWIMNFSGLLAYNLLTAILPIAIALFGILGLILGGHNNPLERNLLQQVPLLFPVNSQDAIRSFLSGATSQIQKDAGILVVIAILLALFGGSRLFITLEGCLDLIYRVRPRTLIRQNVMAFLMLLLFIVLIPIMFLASTTPAFILSFLNNQPQLKLLPFFVAFTNSFVVTYLVGLASSLIASFILFETIYFVVPNQKIRWRTSWPGALAASILLLLFLQLFPFYTTNFLKGYSGVIGLAVIIILFLYYFAVILLLGSEVNAFFFEHIQPLPNDLITFVSTMAGKLNKDLPDGEAEHHVDPKPTNQKDHRHVTEGLAAALQEHQQENLPNTNTLPQNEGPRQTASAHKDHSRGMAAVSVLFGSALTVAIEFFRLRHHGK